MKQKFYLLLTGIILLTVQVKAQAPNSLNYQGVARGITGAVLPDQTINLRFTVHEGSASGTGVYQETQLVVTNEFGLFTAALGTGSITLGSFATIGWGSDAFYLQVEMDPAGGNNFYNMGTNQFLSVPYALYAASAGNSGSTYTAGAGINITGSVISAQAANPLWNANELQGNSVSNTTPTNGQVLEWNGTAWAPTTISVPQSGWSLTGNSGTTAGTNFIGTTDAQDLVFKANSTEDMRILNSNGYVGIGTNAPSQQLEIVANANNGSDFGGYNMVVEIEEANSSGNMSGLYLNGSTNPGNQLAGIVTRGGNNEAFYAGTNNNWDYRLAPITEIDGNGLTNAKDGSGGITLLNSNGFVGLGTSSPAQPLHVVETNNNGSDFGGYNFPLEIESQGGTNSGIYINGSSSNNGLSGIVQGGFSTAFYEGLNNNSDYRIAAVNGLDEGDLTNAKDGSAGITISESSGNVGIGTSSPAQALDVESGNVQFVGSLMPNGDAGGLGEVLQSNGPNSAPTWVVSSGGGGAWALNGNTGTVYPSNFIGTTDDNGLQFEVNNNEAGLIEDYEGGQGGNANTGLGYQSLFNNFNNGGYENTATGFNAMYSNNYGNDNDADGYQALYSNYSGYYNVAIGSQAMYYNQYGIQNTAIGQQALYNNDNTGDDQGWYNVAVGSQAMQANTDGQWNACVGTVGMLNNTTGTKNTGMGSPTMYNNTTGSYNVALGTNALNTNQTGNNLTALGYLADVTTDGLTNSTVIGNGAVVSTSNTMVLGNNSVVELDFNGSLTPWNGSSYDPGQPGYVLQSNGAGNAPTWVAGGGGGSGWGLTGNSGTTYGTNFLGTTDDQGILFEINGAVSGRIEDNNGSNGSYANTGLGFQSLNSVTSSATGNTAFGYQALLNDNTGANNTAIGLYSLVGNTSGSSNIAIGLFAIDGENGTTTGSNNVAIGVGAQYSGSGNQNTSLGTNAGHGIVNSSSNVSVGYEALAGNMNNGQDPGSQNVAIGSYALYSSSSTSQNVAIGDSAMASNSSGNGNTAMGFQAMTSNNYSSGNTVVGYQAMYNSDNDFSGSSSNNTVMGNVAMYENIDGSENVAVGNGALYSNQTAINNTAIGFNALYNNNSDNFSPAWYNTAIGNNAMLNNIDGQWNTAVGDIALMNNTTGDKNCALGTSMESNTTGSYNVSAGQDALANNNSGNYNTAIGVQAGDQADASDNTSVGYNTLQTNNTGSDITVIGFQADVSTDGLSNATAIGSGAVVGESNALVLGSSGTSVGINTSTPNSSLQVSNGSVSMPITVSATSVDLSSAPNTYTIIITATGQTVTLPPASSCTGRMYIIVAQFASGSVTTSSFKNQSGTPTTTLGAQGSITLQSDGTNWDQIR